MIHLVAVWQYIASHPLGILLAIVASFVVGFLWHGPLFGKHWMKFNKIAQPKPGEVTFSMMLPGILASIAMALVQSAVLGRTFEILLLSHVGHALIIATIIWLPFTALVLLNEYTWAGKSYGHTAFDSAYNLVSLWAIAAVLYYTL
jgi:hypothetical protein